MSLQRYFYITLCLICSTLLVAGFYLQYIVGLEPCPLCILQRLAYLLIGLLSLLAFIHNPEEVYTKLIYKGLVFIISCCGVGIASRQTWLQYLPEEEIPECGPGLGYILDTFPVFEALEMILIGSGECAEVKWRFLGLSIAEWSLLNFTCLVTASIIILFLDKNNRMVK